MPWYDTDYGYKKKITIDNTKVSGDEIDFPVLISVTDNDLRDEANGGHVKSASGYDIIFTNAAETVQLKHEIERYVNTSGLLVYWVKIPSLSSTVDTDFYIYYGKTGVVADPSSTDTWDSNFVMVQHLTETSGDHIDSTSKGNDLSLDNSVTGQGTATGKIGKCDDFERDNGDRISQDNIGTHNAYTVDVWVKFESLTDFEQVLNSDSSAHITAYSDGRLWARGTGETAPRTVTTGTWYHLTQRCDGTDAELFINSVGKGSGASTADMTGKIEFGGYGVVEYWFDGLMDEIRVSDTARSNNWLSTSYNTQNDPATFMGFGSEVIGQLCEESISVHDSSPLLDFEGEYIVTPEEDIALSDVLSRVINKTFTETITLTDSTVKILNVMIIPETGYAVFVEGSGYERVYNVFSVKYDDPNIVLTDVPTFEVETDNITGRRLNQYSVGKGCRVYRNGILEFQGEVEPRGFKKGSSGNAMTFGGPHQGYKYLQDRVCDYYRADNNSYAPVVNPWRFGRKIDDTDNTLVDGLRPDEIMECLIGTKFIWQEWFDNHDFLRWTTTQAELVVYDGVLKLPKTAASGDTADSYATSGYVESIGLYNGDKHVDEMGEITTVTAKLIGTKYSTYDPTVFVCRDADEASPTWSEISLSYGAGVWTGTATLTADGAPVTSQFGYYMSMDGDGAGSTEIDYTRFDCDTVSDTTITAGTIDPYNDPNTSDDTVAINLAGMTRLEGLEKIRQLTNTSTAYADVNWDAYIDNDLQFHFTTVRGEDVDKTFSFDNMNLTLIDQKYDGKIKNALIALGQGEEPYAVTITGTDLQDTTSIAEYGKKTGYFVDKSIPDAPTLYKRAKAYLKYMKDPREILAIDICNDPAMSWDVGDRIKINDTELDIDGYYRVLSRAVTKKQDADEQVKIELGNKSNTVGGLFKNISDRFGNQEVITQGTGSPTNTLAAGLVYDKDTAAEYPFYVPKNAQRVVVSVATHKFRAYSKAAAAESAHTHDITGETTDSKAAGMTAIWSNPQTRTNVTVAATSYTWFRCNTVIPSYVGRLFVWCTVKADDGGTICSYVNSIGGASSQDHFYASQYWIIYTNAQEYLSQVTSPFTAGADHDGEYFWMQIGNPTDAERTYDIIWWVYKELAHDHDLTGVATGGGSAHTHSIDYGIYEFGYYPAKTNMKIDSTSNPIVQKFGLIGAEDAAATVVDLDITDNLRDTNGKIVEGAHTLYFTSQTSTNNTDGLGIISVNHKITINTASDVDLAPLVI